MKLLAWTLALVAPAVLAGTHAVGPPCVQGEPGRGGVIVEHSGQQNTDFTVHITDRNGDDLFTVPLQGTNVPGFGSVAVYVQPTGVADVCDAWNETVLPAVAGGNAGARSGLFIEAFVFDVVLARYVMHDIWDTISILGAVRFPDLYMDADNDGVADAGSTLYSVVNLATFDPMPAFTFGDRYQVVNGRVTGIDMLFSTTRPVFSPSQGWVGTAYTGGAVVETDHTVPEPGALGLTLGALTCALWAARAGCRRPR